MSMAVAVGEGVANMIQPFWLLPLLAIAKLNVRQVMGFTIVAFLIGLVVLGADHSDRALRDLTPRYFERVQLADPWWPGAGSNRRPSAFQADARTD